MSIQSVLLRNVCISVATLCLSMTSAYATLESRLGGLAVYDTDLNITWATNANINGSMNWFPANGWVAGLNIDGVSGWRLPTSDTCTAYNCTGSEMGYLFYTELGGVAGQSIATNHNGNYSLFSHLQTFAYWSGTVDASNSSDYYYFNFSNGRQYTAYKGTALFAMAVHDGDVAAVPEPESYAMLLAGLGLLGFMVRRRRR